TTVYESINKDFPNPERGFYAASSPLTNESEPPLQLSTLQEVRNRNITLVRRFYLISEFRDKPLSQAFLQMISNDFETARQAGVKLIPRFAYNWVGGGPDASKNRIFSHLEQLQPIFEANYDVIAYVEAGFIGYWGEWHTSSNGLDKNPEDRREILFKLLSVLPSERMVTIRYAHYKRDAFNDENPLTSDKAFNGTYQARTGAQNQCFLADIDDWGTYNSTDPEDIDKQKTFLSLDNRYVVQGGEVCNPSKYDDCPNTLNELARMRWSTLNADVYDGKEVLQGWEVQGCMEKIKSRLGYRFRLLKSEIPQRVKPGGTFSMKFEIVNDGWASPYNPRRLEVILRNSQTENEYYLPRNDDPRMWMPGDTETINIVGGIPKTIPSGKYQVLLNLPDSTPELYNRPEYSIRLANQNVWESTGYNSLLTSILVEQNADESHYSGEQFFMSRN
ncbi:MAG: DUF4832 domain-containing protein, partial [Rhizonema sp. NSF051]|nr:DUF4832 domain-containing protein [Rhizonema sp. NSF051]